MGIYMRLASFVIAGVVIFTMPLISSLNLAQAAGEASISGVVTDNTGKPVRGALVKTTLGVKAVARYTDSAGRYQITGLESGPHDVTVDAFGFALSKQNSDPAKGGETNFKLNPQMDLTRLVSAEIRYLIPGTVEDDTVQAYDRCSNCHGLETVLPMAGMPAAAWQGFLPVMTLARSGVNNFEAARVEGMIPGVSALFGSEGILGPKKVELDFSKVKYTPLTDTVLKATITEWAIPTPKTQAHSVSVDDKTGIVWFSGIDAISNTVVRFDPETETFQEFPNPVPKARAHTGTVLKDGRFLVAMDRHGVAPKLAIADASGILETFDWPEKDQGSRVVVPDPTRDNVVWVVAGRETWSLNIKTKEFRAYKNPVPESPPQGSYAAKSGEMSQGDINGYALTVDSKGFPWVTQLYLGTVFRVDPTTGKTKSYHTPEMLSARGIAVDAEDNLWFGDYYGNKLGMLDPKTGEVKLYQPPTRYATPYGVTVDHRRGHVWYGDTTGNHITRFDPKTGKFDEYSLPSRNSGLRFMAVDPKGRAWYGGYWSGVLGMIDPGDGG